MQRSAYTNVEENNEDKEAPALSLVSAIAVEPSIFREAQPGIMGAPSDGKRWRPVSSAVMIKDV